MSDSQAGHARILIGDDQPDVLRALRLLLKPEGYGIEAAGSVAEVLDAVRQRDFDVVLMDMNYVRGSTSGQEGLDLLFKIHQTDSTLPVVVMTAWSSVELAVEAMRRGARDFVTKPWKNERLLTVLRTQVELGRALRRGRQLEQENLLLRDDARPLLIARSRAMQPVLEVIARVGPSEANVLITGENGAGKGVVAQALHAASARKDATLVTVNSASIAETIFESELFGHVAGAFTDARTDRIGRFKLADGGTLFLDEIASIPVNLQSKLLRVLESGQFEPVGSSKTLHVDVRILSATNADIDEEVRGGRFRQDLLYRLQTIRVHVPPLRERREDIPLLAAHYLHRYAVRYRKDLTAFDAASMQVLLNYTWPGNVRQLDHTVERAVLMAQGPTVRAGDLGLEAAFDNRPALDEMTIEQAEQMLIRKALSRFQGDISHAAESLGLSRGALYRRMEKYDID
ncbi:sigma-54-dependent transcriptional regulator [Anaerobaca lacustris]|uniref:Sigma-54 dependent transcriptional regulator n=1 Tax=Anaerobaca lacustris TaxID=3044600 RepID=A0AAW6TWT0_9BACT|nr:sigma-54 dependent transcriptional regulator [Sedimentisphaerales bacterium M17dextr]